MLSDRINSGATKIRLDGLENQGGQRLDELLEWLRKVGPANQYSLQPASSDASFRRYFRLVCSAGTLIVMDAPPEREPLHSFVEVDRLFAGVGVRVPEIVEYDLNRGFMLLEDFGSTSYLSTLDTETAAELYADAMQVLRLFNNDLDPGQSELPRYDHHLVQREMGLFEEWFLAGKLGIQLTKAEVELLQSAKAFLTQVMLEQPSVVVHRDFHSRNLMLVDGLNPGVLDFQDAVVGPLTYDLVSLLRDCYIAWPETAVVQWVRDYFDGLNLDGVDFEQYYRWFDLTGLQRHMKALGIFSRLDLRDGKSDYLGDIPRTFDYVQAVASRYAELSALDNFLTEIVSARLSRVISQ